MVKRFLERFELWREEQRQGREDKIVGGLLFFVALTIAQDVYTLVRAHELPWRAIINSILVFSFAVLYIRRSPRTWIVLMVFAITFIIDAPLLYIRAAPHIPHTPRLITAALIGAVGLASIIYSLVLRRRFRSDATPTI
ncbi:MAG: hypothetical protein QOC70_326 [Verrucomicrobiota bacterium]|jgi:hypothetical protein